MKVKLNKKQMIELLSWSIGCTCYRYILFLFEQNNHSDDDLNTLSDIFSKRYYSGNVLDAACFTAFIENIKTVVEFEELLMEVNASYRDYG